MKLVRFILVLVLVAGAERVAAQQQFGPEWGANQSQEERHTNVLMFNFYKDAYQAQRYDDALRFLPMLIERAPSAQQNTYVYGINIYKSKAGKLTRREELAERNRYIDSIFVLYDLRLQYFGDRYGNAITVNKAKDYLSYRKNDVQGVIRMFTAAIDYNVDAPDLEFINGYFSQLTEYFKSDLLETDEYLSEYERLSSIVEQTIGNDDAKKTFEAIFVSSNAANCEKLEQIFKTRLATDPNNAVQLRRAFGMLSARKCTSDFYFTVGEKLFSLEPSASLAMTIATNFEYAGRAQKALQYLRSAVSVETDPLMKSNLCVQISGTELSMGNSQTAADFARQAIGYNPENGLAYLCLGYAYSAGTGSCGDDFDRRTAYWIAYDVTSTAVAKLSDEAQIRSANEALARYRRNFPTREDLFFRGISVGSGYTVHCGWISGGTSVRSSD